jgi:hypothetical protein
MNHLKQYPEKGFLGQLNLMIPWKEFKPTLVKTRNKPHLSCSGIKPDYLIANSKMKRISLEA